LPAEAVKLAESTEVLWIATASTLTFGAMVGLLVGFIWAGHGGAGVEAGVIGFVVASGAEGLFWAWYLPRRQLRKVDTTEGDQYPEV
jgi:hypothetical protein